ncbi:MAG: CerR family C-terminal domain-containing protein [Planctomycetes bacterium]|nr:CerR family C-terminal domain-containing protein [Planctomycetota bacterium]
MEQPEQHCGNTRQRLLESACEVFARKGYRAATIAEICERASANIAAVNYHFRDKASLYGEAWRLAFDLSIERHPPDGGVPPEAPAAERLRGHILAIVSRVADPQSYEFEIIHKELANPTGLLTGVMGECIEPIRRCFEAIVRELLGEAATDEQVWLCQMSVRSQCFDLMIHHQRRRLFGHREPPGPVPPPAIDVKILADHIADFCLAGIADLRRRIENHETTESESSL